MADPVAADDVHLGRDPGIVHAGDPIPPSFVDQFGTTLKTDYDRLRRLGYIVEGDARKAKGVSVEITGDSSDLSDTRALLEGLTRRELQGKAKAAGVPASGTKAELVDRLAAAAE